MKWKWMATLCTRLIHAPQILLQTNSRDRQKNNGKAKQAKSRSDIHNQVRFSQAA
jgi:hypothetical protein